MSPYRQHLQEILHDAYPPARRKHALALKHCFGAMAGYADGNIFCVCGRFGFALKLARKDVAALLKDGAAPLRYFPNGHVKKDYVVLPAGTLRDAGRLRKLVAKSLANVAAPRDRPGIAE